MTKKIKFFTLILSLWSGSLQAQSIMIMVDPNPSPYISDWENKKFASVIGEVNSSMDVICKVKAELFDGKGSLVAYTDVPKMPILTMSQGINQYNIEDIFPISAIKYKGNLEKTTLKTGRIPDDNYKFCVTLVDSKTFTPIGTSGTVCKIFNITAYQAPTLIAPTENEVIPESGVKGIVFRWTPVTPSPKTIVTYRLQVFEVMAGQSNITALRGNQPIVEKDLKGVLQTQWPVEFTMPEVGKNYVWTVTPLDDQERKLVDGNGFAQPLGFLITMATGKINPNLNDSIIALMDTINNAPIMDVLCRVYCTITSWTDSRGCVHSTQVCTAICPTGVSQDWYHGRACDGASTNKLMKDSSNKENFLSLMKSDKKEIKYKGKDKIVKEMIRIYTEIYDELIKNKILTDDQKDSVMDIATNRINSMIPNNYDINNEGIRSSISKSDNVPGALITAEVWNEVQKNYTIVETKKTDHLGTYHFRNLKAGKYRLNVLLPGTIEDWNKKSEEIKPQTLHVNFQLKVNSIEPMLRGSKSGNNPLRFVSPDFLVDEKLNSVVGKVFNSVNNYGINDEGIKREVQPAYDTLSEIIQGGQTGLVYLVGYSCSRPCPEPPGGSDYFSYISDGGNTLIKYVGCDGVLHEWFYMPGYSENLKTYSSLDPKINESFNILINAYSTLLLKKKITRSDINDIMNPALEKAAENINIRENKGKCGASYRYELLYRFEELKRENKH